MRIEKLTFCRFCFAGINDSPKSKINHLLDCHFDKPNANTNGQNEMEQKGRRQFKKAKGSARA